jgi:hypothetical protein
MSNIREYGPIRIFLFLISSVFLGYTLHPVPKWLNNLFENNIIFKFFVMLIVSSIAVYPMSKQEFLYIILFSIIVLSIFELLRLFDQPLVEKDQ